MQAIRVWAKSTMTENGCPTSTRSKRPRTRRHVPQPVDNGRFLDPRATAALAAARELAMLKQCSSEWHDDPVAPPPIPVLRRVAYRSSSEAGEKPVVSIVAASANSCPWTSSRLTTARSDSSAVNSRALAAKYCSSVAWKSRGGLDPSW